MSWLSDMKKITFEQMSPMIIREELDYLNVLNKFYQFKLVNKLARVVYYHMSEKF